MNSPTTRLLQPDERNMLLPAAASMPRVVIRLANSHLKCKAGFCEDFEWSEIVESLSRSIVESIRDVCKGVV